MQLRRRLVLSTFSIRDVNCSPSPASFAQSTFVMCRRRFHSGIDDTRKRRFIKSGMMQNKPRGRDDYSEAFEARIDLKPMLSVGDLYSGDDFGSTAVVVPVTSGCEVDDVVQLPAACRFHYDSDLFPRRRLQPEVQSEGLRQSEGFSAEEEEMIREGPTYQQIMRRFLRRDGDTFSTPITAARTPSTTTTTTTTASSSTTSGAADDGLLVFVVNPVLDNISYRREEAEVEMISAYRNILAEACEWSMGSPLPTEESLSSSSGSRLPPKRRRLTRLRLPVLSIDTTSVELRDLIPKLTQTAVIKAFHRVHLKYKEHILFAASAPITSRNQVYNHLSAAEEGGSEFRIELFVPPHLFQQYQQTFLEDAWAPRTSIMDPGRLDWYPLLPPPEQLAVCEGWVGKRPELLEAIKTQTAVYEKGVQYALDGSVVTPCDVQAELNIFGVDASIKSIVAREEEAAAAAAITSGRQADAGQP